MLLLRRLLFCFLFAACLLLTLAAHVGAATFTVTDLTDNSNDMGSLRYAVDNANTGDTITFQSGLTGTITLAGRLFVATGVTITGPGAGMLAVSGNSAHVVFEIASPSVFISGLTIEGGSNNGTTQATAVNGDNGGGVVVDSGDAATFTSCAFVGNSAGSGGGGLDNEGTVTLMSCMFTGNTAAIGGGGVNNDATATLTNCTFAQNSANQGSAFNDTINGTASLINCTITDNTQGAAVFAGSTVTLTNDILYADAGGEVTPGGAATASYCDIGEVIGASGDGVADGGHNLNDLTSDSAELNPQFLNAPANLAIAGTSPCLGAANPAAAPKFPCKSNRVRGSCG